MLSPSQCVSKSMEARAQSIHYNSISVGKLFTGASILALSHCVFLWKLLYLDVCPLGLQALHAGQNLLLVAGKTHTHLSQLTARRTERKDKYNSLMTLSEKKTTSSLKCHAAAKVSSPRYLCISPS